MTAIITFDCTSCYKSTQLLWEGQSRSPRFTDLPYTDAVSSPRYSFRSAPPEAQQHYARHVPPCFHCGGALIDIHDRLDILIHHFMATAATEPSLALYLGRDERNALDGRYLQHGKPDLTKRWQVSTYRDYPIHEVAAQNHLNVAVI